MELRPVDHRASRASIVSALRNGQILETTSATVHMGSRVESRNRASPHPTIPSSAAEYYGSPHRFRLTGQIGFRHADHRLSIGISHAYEGRLSAVRSMALVIAARRNPPPRRRTSNSPRADAGQTRARRAFSSEAVTEQRRSRSSARTGVLARPRGTEAIGKRLCSNIFSRVSPGALHKQGVSRCRPQGVDRANIESIPRVCLIRPRHVVSRHLSASRRPP
jgi:hypothetical protein